MDFPTADEVKRVVAATATPRQRALLLTAALTGLRASELRGLRWSDVDLEKAHELHVRQRADRFNSIGRPKSRAGTRTIPLAAPAVAALREWKIGCPNSAGGLVFPATHGMIESYNILRYEFEAVMRAALVVERVSGKPKYGLHGFRHFFASWCINPKDRDGRELPAKLVQDLTGRCHCAIPASDISQGSS